MNARFVLVLLCIACLLYSCLVYFLSDTMVRAGTPSNEVMAGKNIWQQKNCQSCHQLYGLGGYMGPDLTNVAGKGPAYMRAFLAKGTGRMPDFHLSENEIHQIVAFLQWIDKSGRNKIPDSASRGFGTYSLTP